MASPLILVAVPVLNRPQRVQRVLASFKASKADARLLFIVNPEDQAERQALEGIPHLVTPFANGPGDWAKKINYAYRMTTEPWILAGADDIHFHPRWDTQALRIAELANARVIGTDDLGNPEVMRKRSFSTHPLVARSYADELGTIDGPGAIMAEVYNHNFPDRELAETAKLRGEWAFATRSVIEHLHPHWGKGEMDAVYEQGSRQFRADRRLFNQRMNIGRRVLRKYQPRRV